LNCEALVEPSMMSVAPRMMVKAELAELPVPLSSSTLPAMPRCASAVGR